MDAVQKSHEPEDGVAGLIERVTFHNEETGFAVLRVKSKGHRDLVTVVGSLASVSAGEWITAKGRWVRDRDHGLQLKAETIYCTAPTSKEGIEKYLGSGMIKGIGPVYAKKLVDKFGESVFGIIESESARLEDIDGIGRGRRQRIKLAWSEQKAIREIMVFLHSNGVSTSRAVRIYKTYGDAAIETVRADPYSLAKDISGIGFKTADRIAEKVGISKESILRARAGLSHTLLEATNAGHCALPKEMLMMKAAALLEIDGVIVEEALAGLLVKGELAEESIGAHQLVYLPGLQRAEEEIAAKISELSSEHSLYPAMDLGKAIEWCEAKTGKELAPSQRAAITMALKHRVVVITGGPGVGKTTLLNSLLLILQAKKVRPLLCAPTGRAAKRLNESTGLEARTIHRLLEFQPGSGGFTRTPERPLDCDLLVVDEMSMVDVPLMHKLLRAVPSSAHLIFVGDRDQLPSVGPGMVLSDLIESKRVPTVQLTEVFRQAATSRIIVNAHKVNEGSMPETSDKSSDSDFYFFERDEPEAIQATILKLIRERVPEKLRCDPIVDVQVLCPMNRGSLGVREMNRILQEALNPLRNHEDYVEKFGWQFRPRDKVIQTQNNYDKEVFNGDIGRIKSVNIEEREVTIEFDTRAVIYDFGELDEVSLAYAISIHKSQGSEFPVVIVPVATQHFLLLQRNLIYTAMTRGRMMVLIVGQKKALEMAVRNNPTSERFSGLLERLRNRPGADPE
ncbi:MAG: ATP-dependent RecD-like helicase [Chthoniobacteraceae bacterium]|nr:ATP-dependent RecD-like helicase [Chthoniobacteraceae bacterium]